MLMSHSGEWPLGAIWEVAGGETAGERERAADREKMINHSVCVRERETYSSTIKTSVSAGVTTVTVISEPAEFTSELLSGSLDCILSGLYHLWI